jgi:hypothetical protein
MSIAPPAFKSATNAIDVIVAHCGLLGLVLEHHGPPALGSLLGAAFVLSSLHPLKDRSLQHPRALQALSRVSIRLYVRHG